MESRIAQRHFTVMRVRLAFLILEVAAGEVFVEPLVGDGGHANTNLSSTASQARSA
jgi:16S rRNA C1402 N4-methylase RsmH